MGANTREYRSLLARTYPKRPAINHTTRGIHRVLVSPGMKRDQRGSRGKTTRGFDKLHIREDFEQSHVRHGNR